MPPSRPSADGGGLAAAWRRRGTAACLLFPLSLLFRALVALRYRLYRAGWLAAWALPVPVVVVGNLTVGGTGKTPMIIRLAQDLRERGRHPGIVSRGYRGSGAGVAEVLPGTDPALVGDEPVLLARRAGCPVFVGRDRIAAARALLSGNPNCDVILSDDGLQHYRLRRDIEIVVFDERGAMNGWCLPAGPLREPLSRLREVDAVVCNGIAVSPTPTFGHPGFTMRLSAGHFFRIDDSTVRCVAADLVGARLHAVAGIGSPRRFFDQLRMMGLHACEHPFPDHHVFRAIDLDFAGDAVLTTEKDAVKLERLRLSLPVWVLPVVAETSPDLAAFVLEKLDGSASA